MTSDLGSMLTSLVVGQRKQSATTALLATLVSEGDRGTTSITNLARDADVSEAKALREVNRFDELGLVTTETQGRQRHVTLNPDSPLHQPLLELLYLTYGVRPPTTNNPVHEWLPGNRFDPQVPHELVPLIPDELHPERGPRGTEPLLTGDTNDGPPLVQLRQWQRKLSGLAGQCGQLEGLLQDAYGTWKHERDRDLIHQLLHVGTGAGYAARVLAYVSDRGALQVRTHQPPIVGRNEWQLAVAATHAEATLCREWSQSLHRAVQLATDRSRTLRRLRELEQQPANQHDTDEPGLAEAAERTDAWRREQIAEHRTTLDELTNAMRGTYQTGGIGVSIDDVNTAGERFILARLHELADTASTYAEKMQQEPELAKTKNSPVR